MKYETNGEILARIVASQRKNFRVQLWGCAFQLLLLGIMAAMRSPVGFAIAFFTALNVQAALVARKRLLESLELQRLLRSSPK